MRSSRDSSVNAVLADFSRRPLRRLPHALRVSPPGLGENSARGSADALQKRTGAVGAYIFRTTDSIAAESMQPFFTVLPTRSTLAACLVVFQISGYGNKLPVTKLRISSCFQADTLGCLAPQGIIEVPAGEAFTIFIVDDDAAVVRALSRLLRSHGYETRSFTSSEKFLEGHDRSLPGCAVLDLSMPGLDGLELQQALACDGVDRPIVFLTGRGDVPSSVKAMKAGAVDFLTKPVDDYELLAAIAQAEELDASSRRTNAELSSIRERISRLTPREREVLGHVVAGKLNKQIAGDLGTVEKTIKVHRARMMKKMNVRSVADLARLAEKAGVSIPAAQDRSST